ncbi:sugar nucleotide-binding protein [Limosilactobacillus reuteri]|nr:sugar nucleotide-binding protein [Limosilactobacillus reuteri]
MTKILITGANGQLGSELRNLLDERGGTVPCQVYTLNNKN